MSDPREAVLRCLRLGLLAGPAVLAFFAGGYFDAPRAWAGLIAWALVAVAALLGRDGWTASRSGWLTLGALALLATWTLLSFTWSPIAGTAYHDGQRVFLYLGAALAGVLLFAGTGARREVEPVLAFGALVVCGYGISERLLPGLLHFHHSLSAEGRLEQPLTYWNAMGALAALGLVLAASLAGGERPRWLRGCGAAAGTALALALYVSFSRGALFAAAAGLLILFVLRPTRGGRHGILVTLGAGVLSCAAAAPLPWVTGLGGSPGARSAEGALMLVVLIVLGGLAAWLAARGVDAPERRVALPRYAGRLAVIVIAGAFVGFLAIGAKERSRAPLASGATRLTTLQSNRYSYWRVAWRAFEAEPVRGVGGGGWALYWLRYRPIESGAQDAHSWPIQTAAELGLIGLALLGAFLAGIAGSARRALAERPGLAAGPAAALVSFGAHTLVDWDWEMPALTLVAILLVALLVRLAGGPPANATAPA